MNAYKETYLNNAADTFGNMMNYVVNDCGLDGDIFLHMFVTSGLAEQFERGNPKVIAGMSGLDLAGHAIRSVTGSPPSAGATDTIDYRTPEFWGGWVLARYQWYSAKSFSAILRSFHSNVRATQQRRQQSAGNHTCKDCACAGLRH